MKCIDNIKFDKIKTIKAEESYRGIWTLKVSNRKLKNMYSYSSFDVIAEFDSLEELKIFCDLHFPNFKLNIITFQDWYHHFYL